MILNIIADSSSCDIWKRKYVKDAECIYNRVKKDLKRHMVGTKLL